MDLHGLPFELRSTAAVSALIDYIAAPALQFRYLYGWGFLLRSGFFMYLMMACFGLTVLIGGLKEIRRWIKAWKDKQTNEVNALTEEY